MATRRWRVLAPPALGLLVLVAIWAAVGLQPVRGSGKAPLPAQATVTPGYIRVQGRIMYIDRNSDRNHPAAGLRVEIWDQDTRSVVTGEKLDETVTDANGFYVSKEILNVDPDGPIGQPEGTQDVFLKLFTENGHVTVLRTGLDQVYSWPSYDVDPKNGLVRNVPDGIVGMSTLYMTENTPEVDALWTFVNLVEGWSFMQAATGRDPGPVRAYWSKTATEGPYYNPNQKAIYLRDADAGFASVVVQQEAYALLHNAYGDLPESWLNCLAGPTDSLSSATNAACAFAQGFATYYPLAVYGDPVFTSLILQGVDLDAPAAGTPGWANGDAVPGRIAGAFWDLDEHDKTQDGYDIFNDTFRRTWQAIASGQPTTMRDWWAAWRAAGGDACSGVSTLFQNTIDYNAAPQVAAIPDAELDEDTTKAVDLKPYVTDAECANDRLTYTALSTGDPQAGVKLVATGVISVTPAANWFGSTSVSVRVSDGPAATIAKFRVVVNSVNDCPVIKPRVADVQVRYGEAIVLNLLAHASDVEDPAYQLRWDVRLEEQDAKVVTVDGAGTTTLTFRLDPIVTTERTVRAVLVVTDRDGCSAEQPVALGWTDRPNQPPWIVKDKLRTEYTFPVNQKIDVDLRGVADDAEDGQVPLEWFVTNSEDLNAQVGYLNGNRQQFQFDPEVDFAGRNVVQLEVRDTRGASASAAITLTWQTREEYNNLAPRILTDRLKGRTVGLNSPACYDLLDKAYDPDDPPASLNWFATDLDSNQLQVSGQGSRELCLKARKDFEGCQVAKFVVRDPKGAEDAAEVRTCWRVIKLYVPFACQPSVGHLGH
jgi:hypothetical protein